MALPHSVVPNFGRRLNGHMDESASSMTSNESSRVNGAADRSGLTDMLRQQLGSDLIDPSDASGGSIADVHDAESLLDYDPDEEDEIIFDADDDMSHSQQNGGPAGSQQRPDSRANFKTPECFIKTTATIVVHKKDTGPDPENDRPTLSQIRDRQQLIFIPASRMKTSLSKRFELQNQKKMKRDLTQEQALLNYLRFKGDAGFSKVFAGTAAAKAQLAERIKLLQETGLKPTMHDKFLASQANDNFDHEAFWREQVALWILKYEWRKRDGPEVSKAELDREIDEWMSKKAEFQTTEEMEQDFTSFMNRRGYDREQADALDHDMDDYWARRGLPQTDDETDDTSTVTSVQTAGSRQNADYSETDLDNDLEEYCRRRGTYEAGSETTPVRTAYSNLLFDRNRLNGNPSTGGSQSGGGDGSSGNTTARKTPQELMRQRAANRIAFEAAERKRRGGADAAEVLDSELDAYMTASRQVDLQIKQEEQEKAEENKRQEEQLNAAAVGEGDRFANCPDFVDDIDEELEWQE